MNTAGTIVVVILVLLVVAAIGWVVFSRWRAQRLGLPPPPLSSFIPFRKAQPSAYGIQPAPGGFVGWFNDQLRRFKNRNVRTAAGAYEGASGVGAQRGARGLDPDDAWDAGAEHDGYGYEEQELGMNPAHGGSHLGVGTEYGSGGGTYNMNLAATPGMAPAGFGDEDDTRGRPRGRSPGLKPSANPFDDDAEPSNLSLRGVSPRPIDTAHAPSAPSRPATKDPGGGESPTERRSVFRENM